MSNPTPSTEFERGARAAAEAMRFYFLDENERSVHADLSEEILEQHEQGAIAITLDDEKQRLARRSEAEIEADTKETRTALEKILDERFPRVEPSVTRSYPRRGDDDAVDARDDERFAIGEFIDLVVDAGFRQIFPSADAS